MRELLAAFQYSTKELQLTLLKKLAPIVRKHVGAAAAKLRPRLRDAASQAAFGASLTVQPIADEESGLLADADDSTVTALVDTLRTEIKQTVRSSLEALVCDAVLSFAWAPLKQAGLSTRQMVMHMDKLEKGLVDKQEKVSLALAKKMGLHNGGIRERLMRATLTVAKQYEVRMGGFDGSLDMVRLAWRFSRAELSKHENELEYIKKKLEQLQALTISEQSWRDAFETFTATLALLKSIDAERGRVVLQCIASDEKLLAALGAAKALYETTGTVSTEVLMRLNKGAGGLRANGYKYDKLISRELVRIGRIKDLQWRCARRARGTPTAAALASCTWPSMPTSISPTLSLSRVVVCMSSAVTLSGSAIVATMIGTANVLGRQYSKLLDSGNVLLAVALPLGTLLLLLLCCCCCGVCYYRDYLSRLARRKRDVDRRVVR
jgi:hypothetical protein